MSYISPVRILKTIRDGKRAVAWNVVFHDDRRGLAIDHHLMIDVDELQFPDAPDELDIIGACYRRIPAPRAARTQYDYNLELIGAPHGMSAEQLRELIPVAYCQLCAGIDESESIRRRAVEITGLSARDVARIEKKGADYADIPHFDEHAQQLAYEFPQLNWDPSDANSGRLWDLLHTPARRKPARNSRAVIDYAIEMARNNSAQIQEVLPF